MGVEILGGSFFERLLQTYSDFYSACGHEPIPRIPLVHPAFRTSFVLSAGVIEMTEELVGLASDHPRRVVVQPCFRHYDLGASHSGKHLSLFHMGAALYFDQSDCRDVLRPLLRFLSEELMIDRSRLWLTAFGGDNVFGHRVDVDTESVNAWLAEGLASSRVVLKGARDNFWREGASSGEPRSGLCGPHTEIFVECEGQQACDHARCGPGCGCGHFVELCNIVFPRFRLVEKRLEHIPGRITEAAIGLDRAAMLAERVPTVYHTSAMRELIRNVVKGPLSHIEDEETIHGVVDYIRSFCCLIVEGGRPGRKGRAHVLRKMMRTCLEILQTCCRQPEECILQVAGLVMQHPECAPEIDMLLEHDKVLAVVSSELRHLSGQREVACNRIPSTAGR